MECHFKQIENEKVIYLVEEDPRFSLRYSDISGTWIFRFTHPNGHTEVLCTKKGASELIEIVNDFMEQFLKGESTT